MFLVRRCVLHNLKKLYCKSNSFIQIIQQIAQISRTFTALSKRSHFPVPYYQAIGFFILPLRSPLTLPSGEPVGEAVAIIWVLCFCNPPHTPLDNVPLMDKWTLILMYAGTCSVIWVEHLRYKKRNIRLSSTIIRA